MVDQIGRLQPERIRGNLADSLGQWSGWRVQGLLKKFIYFATHICRAFPPTVFFVFLFVFCISIFWAKVFFFWFLFFVF